MKKELKPEEISLFCTQIVYILQAGIAINDGVALICEDIESGTLKDTFVNVNKKTAQGSPLSAAMEETGVFPQYVVSMVNIGETTGKTEDVLRSLSEYYEREKALRQKLYTAVFNPIMLFVMMSAVVVLLVTEVMPMFANMFNQLGGSISVETGAAVNFGIAAGIAALVIIVLITLILITGAVMLKTTRGHFYFDTAVSKFPATKKLSSKIAARNFSSAMHLMLSSGVGTSDSMRLAANIVNNELLKQKVLSAAERLEAGESFIDALIKAEIFSGLYTSMLNVGFKTGSMDDVMKKLSGVYEEEVNTALNNLANVVEPVLVGILAVIIGSVLIAVMLPLAGIMSSIG